MSLQNARDFPYKLRESDGLIFQRSKKSGMASFTDFNVTYGDDGHGNLGYNLSYTISDPAPPANYAIEVLLWYGQIDYIVHAPSPIFIG